MDWKQLKKEIIEQRGIRKSYNVSKGLELLDIENLKDKRVLEICCGEGNLSIYLSKYAKEVVGIDIDKKCISTASDKAKDLAIENCDFINSDILYTNLEDESFDLIIGEAALHHIIYDFDIGKKLHELLNKNGKLIFITEPLSYNLFSEGIRFMRHHINHAFGEFSLWYEHIEAFGSEFESIDYQYFDIFSHPFKALEKVLPANAFRFVMKWLWGIDEFIFKHAKSLRKYAPNVNIVMVKNDR